MADDLSRAFARRLPVLEALGRRLQEVTAEAVEGFEHIDRIAFRTKTLRSFVTKASGSDYSQPLEEIEDQIAGRVIVFFLEDLTKVQAALTDVFGPVEVRRHEPVDAKTFDYESQHFVFVISRHHLPPGWDDLPHMPRTFEMQVRTLFMHAWAEPQHNLGYKGSVPLGRETERELAWIAASAWGADKAMNDVQRRLTAS